MRDTTSDLLSRIEKLEAQLKTLKAAQPPGSDAVTTPKPTEHIAGDPSSRRDLLRYGAVAFGAAATAGMTASPVAAADGGPVVLGVQNTATNATSISATLQTGLAVTTSASGAPGIVASGPGYGLYAEASAFNGAAVQGWVYEGTAAGVRGNSNSATGVGVHGGNNVGGNAVRAEISSLSVVNGIAMYALNYSTYTGGAPGAGGFAIYGLSAKGHGLVGATATAGGAAVVGASNGVVGAYAAAFYGTTIVSGDFTVVGGAKSAAVPHPDGSHRRLYCMESPESWFEDFGEGALVCGEASITLDPDFAAVVDASKYHVFLTAHRSNADLAVTERSADRFCVRGREGAEGTFSWRVVAKRKDIAAPRFEMVEIPKAPTLPPVPGSATATDPPPVPLLPGRPKSRA